METIYYGGPILTMEKQSDHPEAILVKKGMIKKTGTLKEVLDAADKNVKKINLDRKSVV